ncbi:DNRLRE domain-containing protein [Chitinophaga sp. SYP-B3965]|uniref:polysaccharide lyase family 8 super-sandwich domain-containing protein n=1 Tax=Chitinophaga sp. SYP-B3965 TaxID=2663120 RepID=UPI00129A01D5|nr:polysaccharide lyase family 8 super-sandwich domain-containing protein [Chitinophaga sp. SYP-B3965]MRG45804.1 DNRLRE domain-containing protein [Chitinophaga sp. SYP-B3965]
MKKALLILSLCLSCWTKLQAQTEYTIIMDRVRAEVLSTASNVTTLDNGVTSTLATLQSNGSWPDISYAYSSTTYTADQHIIRVKNFVIAYSKSNSSYYHDTTLFNAIVSSLTYWDTADPQSWNWYHNQISNPQYLGEILIMLEIAPEFIGTTLRNNLLSQMNRGVPANQTGANKLDVATHFIYRGCLTANASVTQTGVTEAFYPILLTTGEGIQHDLSYQQHGPQLYMFGYGSVFVNGEAKVAHYLRGTSYALSGTKLALFSNFVRNGYLKVMRGKYIDYSVNGRSISRSNNLSQGGTGSFNKLKDLDTAHIAEYNEIIARLSGTQPPSYMIDPSHTQFWRSDYTIHHRPGYFFGLRNASTRTSKSENGNGENLKGYYLSEGATNITVSGTEYHNIFPVWDWARIPGTTVPVITTFPLRTPWGADHGTATFSGGMSDSLYGATALAFNDYSTQARKAWFFFDKEVVCLGANINSTAAQAINTTVEQSLLNGTVTVNSNGTTTTVPAGSYTYNNNLKWITHNGISYYFPSGGNMQLTTQAQTGTWKSINNGGSTTSVSMNVFKLWFNHGVAPTGGAYAYYVIPGQSMPAYDTTQVRVLNNNGDVQAVRHVGLNVWQLVFYKAGTFSKDSVTVTVDRACVIMLKNVGTANVSLSIADPAQSADPINVYINTPGIANTRQLICNLPSGSSAGSSVRYNVSASTPVYTPAPTIPAIADAYVRNGTSYAGVNYGTVNSLVIKKDGVGYARETFFKFNVANIPVSTDRVKLRLYVNYANTGIAAVTWTAQYVSTDSWTETGINWNNMPVTNSNLDTITAKAAGNYVEFDVSAIALSQQSADGVLSLKVISNVTGQTSDASFSSRESGDTNLRPVLLCSTDSGLFSKMPDTESETTGVKIYPNPAAAFIRIEASGYRRAELRNVSGQLLRQEDISGRQQFDFSLKGISPGMYLLHLQGQNGVIVKKVIKI